jgi:hypothetical protein
MHLFKRNVLLVGTVALVLFAAYALQQATPRAQATSTSGTGGTLSIGTPAAAAGDVKIPINTTASTNPYKGSSIHLVWDATQYTFSQVTKGTVFGVLSPLCLSTADAGGGGVAASCIGLGAFSSSSSGSLLNIFVTPLVAPACSTFHIFTLNAPDNGDGTSGSYTLSPANAIPPNAIMANTYGPDVNISNTATTGCTPAVIVPTNTPTPIATDTPAATGTPTDTPTPTTTPLGGFRTVTPTPTFTLTPTNTAVPPPPTAAGPGAIPPAPQPAGAGAAGGRIRLPDTGTGRGSGGWDVPMLLVAAALALLAAGSGCAGLAYGHRQRRSHR